MKRYTLVMPQANAELAAQWLFENEVRMLLSYSVSDFFSDTKIVIICGVPDDKETAFKTQFSKSIKS